MDHDASNCPHWRKDASTEDNNNDSDEAGLMVMDLVESIIYYWIVELLNIKSHGWPLLRFRRYSGDASHLQKNFSTSGL